MIPRRDLVLSTLAAHHGDLVASGVRSLFLFGSVARDEARDGSDVDLLVEFEHRVGFFSLFRLQTQLESWLGTPVDLVTPDALRTGMRDRVWREALRAA
ncbi:MAG: nucleotidyltransferase family protein [Polyangiaceae bacterium]